MRNTIKLFVAIIALVCAMTYFGVSDANALSTEQLTVNQIDLVEYTKNMSLEEQINTAQTFKKSAHTMAKSARELTFKEDSSIILNAKDLWSQANDIETKALKELERIKKEQEKKAKEAEYQKNLDLLARIVWCEAGSSWLKDEHQQLVAMVVLNRIASPRFPNTLEGVIYARGQYSCIGNKYWNMKPPQRCYDNAEKALQGLVSCPSNVVFQAEFKQGSGVFKSFYNSYSGTTTYFCYQ